MEMFRLLSSKGHGTGTPLLVAGPVDRLIPSKLLQVPPREEAGVMPVIEDDFDGVLAHRLDCADANVFLAQHQHLLSGTVSFDFGGRGMHTEVLEWQLEAATIGEMHLEQSGSAADFDFGCDRITHNPASIGRDL